MKKILAILITLCMLVPLYGVAEEFEFTLRNGYRWDMTLDDIAKLAEEEGLTLVDSSPYYLIYENTPVAGYMAYFRVSHTEKIGLRFSYTFRLLDPDPASDVNQQMYNVLLAKLIDTYGEPTKYTNPTDTRSDVIWILPPDTEIELSIYNIGEPDQYYCIVYFYEPQPIVTPSPTPIPTPEFTLVPVPNDGL